MITIDRVTRQMKIPDKEKILGVVSDEDSHTLYFTCASILDQNFDLTTANIYINYRRSDGEIGQYMVTDKSVVKGTCTFSWLVSRAAYTQKGTVDFIVCMKIVDEDGIVQKEWNTTLGHLTVLEGLEPEGEIPIPPADTDLISQLMNYVKSTVDQAEADINSTKTSAIEALDQKETEISDAIDDKIADLNTLGVVHPNLLINSDFKSGIINQRGFDNTTITGWSKKGTIDRWIFSGSGDATAEIDTDSMSISGDSSLIQTLSQQCQPGIYTVATNITDLTGTLKISLVYTDDTTIDSTVSGTGLFVHTFEATKAVKGVMFRCNGASSSFTFDSIKLEKGSIFTGMPQWDETTELLKCKRHFQQYYRYPIFKTSSTTNVSYFVPVSFQVEMAKMPTITKVEILNGSNASETGANINSSVLSVNNIVKIQLDKTIGETGYFTFYLDAEIY